MTAGCLPKFRGWVLAVFPKDTTKQLLLWHLHDIKGYMAPEDHVKYGHTEIRNGEILQLTQGRPRGPWHISWGTNVGMCG